MRKKTCDDIVVAGFYHPRHLNGADIRLAYARLVLAKSQLTSDQNASRYFGRALR